MFYFLKFAIRNIFKNKRNTFTIALVVFICVFAMEITVGYMDGFKDKLANDSLEDVGHITLYNEKYYNNLDFMPLDYNMEYTAQVRKKILDTPNVKGIRPEINFGAMANSKTDNHEAMVKGIDIGFENSMYDERKKSIIEGRFIEKSGELIIGYKAADLLNVKPGDSLILLTMDQYGSMNAMENTVTGIFRSNAPSEDEGLVICPLEDVQKLLWLEGRVTEIKVNVDEYMGYGMRAEQEIQEMRQKAENAETAEKKQQILDELNNKYPLKGPRKTAVLLEKKLSSSVAAVPWQEEQSFVLLAMYMMDIWTFIMAGIIVFVAGMGITNSFLMNIMGRMPEFGMMRAMGLSKKQMFGMITAESFFLGLLGTIAGLLPGAALVWYFQENPINYGNMAEVIETYEGLDSVIGTSLTIEGLLIVFAMGVLISVAASLYPAGLAIRKKTVDVLRGMR